MTVTDTMIERIRRVREVLSGRSGRLAYYQRHPGVVSLATGSGTRRPHVSVIEAAVRSLLGSENYSFDNYHFLQPYAPMIEAARRDLAAMGVPDSHRDSVLVDFGSSGIITSAFSLLLQPGDVVLTAPGFYHGLIEWCDLAGLRLAVAGSDDGGPPRLTAQSIRRWFAGLDAETRKRNSAVFFSNPTFTGHVYSQAELEDLAGTIAEIDALVICDMVFAGTEFGDERAVSLASFDELAGKVLTVKSVSKTHNLANLRVGWAGGPSELIRRLDDHRESTKGTVPFLCQSMAAAAIDAPEDYFRANAHECQDRADLIVNWAKRLNRAANGRFGIGNCITPVAIPQSGHSILLDAPDLRGLLTPDGARLNSSADLGEYLLQHHRVCISPAYSMGFDGMEFRIAFGSVGLDLSYPASRAEELSAVRRSVGATELTFETLENPFREGSELLRSACDAIGRATMALLEHNRAQSSAHQLKHA
ncbi:pyridoxal phosphate-dependent aminotransferase [uncultured Roseibium sp.]|uniref:pyridoxal phosphate-dependent aminotransferase n=1 Tax=uncultured Roseibium sp. TaxID=1936171 RepID=UPI0026367335|nr:pyridoxal phosphate-dependent aminotransferase [uncultured Roseibium sp.]